MMDKNAAYRLDVANATGMRANSFSIVDINDLVQDPFADEVFPNEEARRLHILTTDFLTFAEESKALADLGDKVPCASSDAKDYKCMLNDLLAAKTIEDFEAIAECYGNLARRPVIKADIESHLSQLRSA